MASLLAVFLQEQAKNSKHKALAWITQNTPVVNRCVAAMSAAITTAGVSYQYDPVLGSLAVQGLTYENVTTALSTWVSSYVVQWAIYSLLLKRKRGKI